MRYLFQMEAHSSFLIGNHAAIFYIIGQPLCVLLGRIHCNFSFPEGGECASSDKVCTTGALAGFEHGQVWSMGRFGAWVTHCNFSTHEGIENASLTKWTLLCGYRSLPLQPPSCGLKLQCNQEVLRKLL